jgi:hypothetical protein
MSSSYLLRSPLSLPAVHFIIKSMYLGISVSKMHRAIRRTPLRPHPPSLPSCVAAAAANSAPTPSFVQHRPSFREIRRPFPAQGIVEPLMRSLAPGGGRGGRGSTAGGTCAGRPVSASEASGSGAPEAFIYFFISFPLSFFLHVVGDLRYRLYHFSAPRCS